MKESNFAALILGTIGGVCFALGMCMALLPEWEMMNQGIVCGVIGLVFGLITIFVWRRMEGKAPIKVSRKNIVRILVAVAGALLLGVGMSLCMVFSKMVLGIVVGVIGIIVQLMLIPMVKGLK